MNKANVLIVGAGPCGLLLALSLRQYGISVHIIDKIEPERNKFSKALSVTSASLKIFHGAGVIENFLAHGKKLTRAEVFFDKKRTASINKKYLNSLYNFYLSIPQFQTEAILENALNSYSTYIQYQQELVDIAQHEKSVHVKTKNLKTNQIKSEQFDFVIGCDGAHSKVRNLLEIPFVGDDYDMHLILGDVYFDPHPSIPTSLTYHIDEKGFIVLYPMNNGCTRIVIQKKGKLPNVTIEITKENLQSHLNICLPHKLTITNLIWSSSARMAYRLAKSNRIDRVFLAGDASHLFSSVGGQAMNTGFQDAFDLAWRLGHYLNGIAKMSLLDTYDKNRSLAIKKVLNSTDLYTKLITREITTHDELAHFKPSFTNRHYYRQELPNEFAGYKADYSENDRGIIGKHVPYIKFKENYYNLSSTYDLPQLKKHILFIPSSLAKISDLKVLDPYTKAIIKIEVGITENEIIEKLQIDEKNLCVISPGGYVVFHGQLSAATEYLKQYY